MNLYESVKSNIKEADEHKTFNYNGTECWMEIGSYSASPTVMAIQFMCHEGPYTTATVNLGEDSGNNSVIPFGASFLDTNNNSGIVDFFKKEGLGEVYTRFGEEVTMQSGFCEYPLFQFNVNKLKEYDPNGFAKYESSYRANLDKARSKVIGESSTEDYQDANEIQQSKTYANKVDLTDEEIIQAAIYVLRQNNNLARVFGWNRFIENAIWNYLKKKKGWTRFPSNLYNRISKVIYKNEKVLKLVDKIKSERMNESTTEDYWDATELDREGFYALLKFNHPEKHMNPSLKYIITNDNNEVYRFAMQGEDETNKDTGAKIEFRKYINKGE